MRSARPDRVPIRAVTAMAFAAASGLAGCGLGGLFYGDTSRTLERPFLVKPYERSSEPVRRITQATSDEVLSAQRLRLDWGEPDTIEPLDGMPNGQFNGERWSYRLDGLRWQGGLLILVVLPLPLLIPVGHESVIFTVQDGVVTHATELRSGPKYGGFCGLPLFHILMFGQLPFVCTAGEVHLTEP
jgi:hypothetical protein